MFTEEDAVLAANQVDMPYAYVVYDHDRAAHVETIRNWVGKSNINSVACLDCRTRSTCCKAPDMDAKKCTQVAARSVSRLK